MVLDGSQRIGPLWASCYCDEDMASQLNMFYVPCFTCVLLFFSRTESKNKSKVGKIKMMAKMAHPNLLGRQVLTRYAAFVAVRWLRQMEGA